MGYYGHGAPTPDTTFPLGRGAVRHAVFDGPLDRAWGAGATDRWLLQEQASEARSALGRTRGRSPDGADRVLPPTSPSGRTGEWALRSDYGGGHLCALLKDCTLRCTSSRLEVPKVYSRCVYYHQVLRVGEFRYNI